MFTFGEQSPPIFVKPPPGIVIPTPVPEPEPAPPVKDGTKEGDNNRLDVKPGARPNLPPPTEPAPGLPAVPSKGDDLESGGDFNQTMLGGGSEGLGTTVVPGEPSIPSPNDTYIRPVINGLRPHQEPPTYD